ncbi:MAG: hypothetical protein JW941_12755, partial [Candidatus Coatesbacteria bacterium]|nr:hypothetical protein [Candidatus Coatesbacteria bacterium]
FTAWAETGAETAGGHTKAAFYFIEVLLQLEPLVLMLGVFGIVVTINSKDVFERFVSLWAILDFIIYSIIPYKTPWLVMNIVVPLLLCAGCFVDRVRRALDDRPVAAVLSIVAFLGALFWSASLAWDISLVRYDDNTEEIVYAHTFREINELVGDIEEAANSIKGSETKIYVFSEKQWPLSWYLHQFDSVYPHEITQRKVDSADIIVASIDQEDDIERYGKGRFVSRRFSLRPEISLTLYIPRKLAGILGDSRTRPNTYLPPNTPIALSEGLIASYFKGQQLLPPPYKVRIEKTVEFEYEADKAKEFTPPTSIRWDGYVQIPDTGEYSFFLTSDDGSRLYLDSVLVIDNWGDHAMATKNCSATLTAGYHRIQVEYYDSGGGAMVLLEWRPPDREIELLTPIYLFHVVEDEPE